MRETWNGHSGSVKDRVSEYTVIECETCGFSHVVPLPGFNELHEAYGEDYYVKDKPLFIERQREDLDWWQLVYDDRYDFFEHYLPLGNRRILDIGCGPGFFLQRGAQRGWHGVGVEPSRQAAEHARDIGVEVVNTSLEEAGLETGAAFDVVHMSEVLEHVPDPASFCRRAAALLKPGGVICIVVPNDYSPFQKALRVACGFSPWWVQPPRHINYFCFDSLKQLLKRCGFTIIKEEATFPIDLFLLMGDNYVGNDQIGRICHGKRKLFELNLDRGGMRELRRELSSSFAQAGIGREIIMYATTSASKDFKPLITE